MGQTEKIITSNIRYADVADGDNGWEYRGDFLAEILWSHRPSILATQEGRRPQIEEFARKLPLLKLLDQGRPWIEERMYPCLFIDPTRFEVVSNGDFWLSETPQVPGSSSFGSAFPRLCTWARLRRGEHHWLVASTHLDHVHAFTRHEQIRVLTRELHLLREPGDSMVLMGDFNDAPFSETRDILMNGFADLSDPWNAKEESSHHPFSGTCPDGHRIDWILLSSDLLPAKIEFDKTQREGKWPSDHFPVVCTLTP
jgi:endonuclease/exonuclease/phosphatase family metal-dependent hydrolase